MNPIVEATATSTMLTLQFRFAGPLGNGTPTAYGTLNDGGFKVTGTGPQTEADDSMTYLAATLYAYDRSLTDGIHFFANAQVQSPDGSLVSNEKTLVTEAGRTYWCVANRCQFFCWVPGTAADNLGSVLAGGLTWVAPASTCGGEAPTTGTNSQFWVSQDYAGGGGLSDCGSTFRTSVVSVGGEHMSSTDLVAQVTQNLGDASGWFDGDAMKNGTVALGTIDVPTQVSYTLKLVSPMTLYIYSNDSGTLVDSPRWLGGNGLTGRRMLLEPLVEWGDAKGDPPYVRGQLWNAWIGTDQVPMDTVQTFPEDSNTYVAFTHAGKFGTLWLQVPAAAPVQLTAISYAH